jgi:phosphoribosylpyrophosphate synthetase
MFPARARGSIATEMNAAPLYRDRHQAGLALAAELRGRDFDDPLVVALQRGGAPVAYEVARALNARAASLWSTSAERRSSPATRSLSVEYPMIDVTGRDVIVVTTESPPA